MLFLGCSYLDNSAFNANILMSSMVENILERLRDCVLTAVTYNEIFRFLSFLSDATLEYGCGPSCCRNFMFCCLNCYHPNGKFEYVVKHRENDEVER